MSVIETDFIFPSRVIPDLRDIRSIAWQEFIDKILNLAPDAPERVALVLMMVRLAGCVTCQADSFKAMRGCSLCASQSVRRFKGDDSELLRQVETALKEILAYQIKGSSH